MWGVLVLTTNPPTPDHIGNVVKIPLRDELHDSIFTNFDKMEESNTFSAPFQHSLLPLGKKIKG